MKQLTSFVYIATSITLLTGCNGSSEDSTTPPPAPTPTNKGVFIDSPVSGLQYQTATQSGVTENGQFEYLDGEQVTFKLGDILLGSAEAKALITPFDLGDKNHSLQVGRLLQSLDKNKNPADGIDLTHIVSANTQGQTLDVPVDQAVIDTIAGTSGQFNLASDEQVVRHLQMFAEQRFMLKDGKALLHGDLSAEEVAMGYESSVRVGSFHPLKQLTISADIGFHSNTIQSPDSIARFRSVFFKETETHELYGAFGIKLVNGEIKPTYYGSLCEKATKQCEETTEIESSQNFWQALEENASVKVQVEQVADTDIRFTVAEQSILLRYPAESMPMFASIDGAWLDLRFRGAADEWVTGSLDNLSIQSEGNPVVSEEFEGTHLNNPAINYVVRRLR